MRVYNGFERGRPLDKGMGVAVGRRTVFRESDKEDMGYVANRVAYGNVSLVEGAKIDTDEFSDLRSMIACGAMLTSGRHLQHGDESQSLRNMEVFTNCSTAALSFPKFYLLLNGSGVGRSYDDELMVVDWRYAPRLTIVLDEHHHDYPKTRSDLFQFARDFNLIGWDVTEETFDEEEARHFLHTQFATHVPEDCTVFYKVADSREGWAKAFEIYETLAYEKRSDHHLVLNFSDVRAKGSPIGGMQNRPASGPLSVMRGFMNVRNNVTHIQKPWMQAMYVDHYLSVEVQVGGARRAARMSTKSWLDEDILDFIKIKAENGLWTSNNSVMVDQQFWKEVKQARAGLLSDTRALEIFNTVTEYAYINGEPGFINGDQLESFKTGTARERPVYDDGSDFGSAKYTVTHADRMLRDVAVRAQNMRFPMTTNPCGEIELHVLGGYCVIGDVAPLLACPYDDNPDLYEWDSRVANSVRLMVRFLMRVNQMDSLYGKEVERTNRIGVSLTGIHEWAFARYGLTFRDLIDEEKSRQFWNHVSHLSAIAKVEAQDYAHQLGTEVPHTVTTIKPAGTTSKLYGLSEGAHLPAMRQYVRWVQFKGQRNSKGEWPSDADPRLPMYEEKGYPIRELRTFPGMSIVGFPTVPMISRMMPEHDIVTASEATPEEQYQWLMLLEKYWIGEKMGNQVSYTLKVFTDRVDLEGFRDIVLQNQSRIRCCSILPTDPGQMMGYEYLPEQEVSLDEFAAMVEGIKDEEVKEDIDLDTLQCASGACPI